ncbi:hypothetical protein GYMLUDRAFT_157418 [Collybiopsis luxurians FD-317 M1]|nr:hypothetical protein GYMLUDRAFT_157418 [Collybiopsis luxurians FD-317 M1]
MAKGSQKPEKLLSYDAMCGLSVNLVPCWSKYFSHLLDFVKDATWLIPTCHVHNHVESCDVLYCYAFKPNTAHFHSKTTEQFWPTLNAIDVSVCQMSLQHCVDVSMLHYGDWNWKKVVGMGK